MHTTRLFDDIGFKTTQYDFGVNGGGVGNRVSAKDLLGVDLDPGPVTGSPSRAPDAIAHNRLGEAFRLTDVRGTKHAYLFDAFGDRRLHWVRRCGGHPGRNLWLGAHV